MEGEADCPSRDTLMSNLRANQEKAELIQQCSLSSRIHPVVEKDLEEMSKNNESGMQTHENQRKRKFSDVREDILTTKVEKALLKVQQIKDQKYSLKLLALKHFLINTARFTQSHMAKHLTNYQKSLIKDSCLPENYSNPTSRAGNQLNKYSAFPEESKSTSFFEAMMARIPVFDPSNNYIVIWDIIQMVFILFFLYAVPLRIVFGMDLGEFISEQVFYLGLTSFALDNVLWINTAYFEKGVPVKDRQLICFHYLKKHFLTDFLSNVPIFADAFLVHFYGTSSFLMLSQFLKVGRITIILRKVEERFHLSPQQQQLVLLVKLLFRVLFVAHIFACIWVYIAINNHTDSTVWLDKFDYNLKPWFDQYLLSYYFTTVTMITVGYGDIAPVNNREFVFCVFEMLIACGVFAYAVNQIGSIFENIGRQEKLMKEMMYRISSYMHLKNVSKELQYQIREYLQYYWTEQQDRDTDIEEKIKNQLSDNLKDLLALEANNIVLKDSIIFKNNFSNDCISKTVPLIKEYRATPEEVIIYENTLTVDQNIYFIEKGQVEVFLDQADNPYPIKKLSAGECFGQIGFFTGTPRTLTVRSLDFTTLVYIKRSEFIDLLKEFPQDYEQFCYIKDKLLNEGDYRLIGMRCYSCKDGKHLSHNCPFLHYTPKRLVLLKNYAYSGFQTRDKFERVKGKTNCLNHQGVTQQKAEDIQEQYSLIIEQLFGSLDEDDYDSDDSQDDINIGGQSKSKSDIRIPTYLLQFQSDKRNKSQSIMQDVSQVIDDEEETGNPSSMTKILPGRTSQLKRDKNSCENNLDSKQEGQSEYNQGQNGGSQLQSSLKLITEEPDKMDNLNIKKMQLRKVSTKHISKKETLSSMGTNITKENQNMTSPSKPFLPGIFRQESKRISTKLQANNQGQRPEIVLLKQISVNTSSKLDSFARQFSKRDALQRKSLRITKNSENLFQGAEGDSNQTLLRHEKKNSIGEGIQPFQLLQRYAESILANQQDISSKNNPVTNSDIIMGSDNKTNFYGLDDLDTLKNYDFYYPTGNSAQVVIKQQCVNLRRFGSSSSLQKEERAFFKPKPPAPSANMLPIMISGVNVDFIRKQRKTGGTRIVSNGGVAGNLINKFRQQEEISETGTQLEESPFNSNNSMLRQTPAMINGFTNNNFSSEMGVESSEFAENGSPFSRKSKGRKNTKRQQIIPLFSPFEDIIKQQNFETVEPRKSKFLGSSIQEEENEENLENIHVLNLGAEFSSKQLFFSGNSNYNHQEATFSQIPSMMNISDNGRLPSFQAFQTKFQTEIFK